MERTDGERIGWSAPWLVARGIAAFLAVPTIWSIVLSPSATVQERAAFWILGAAIWAWLMRRGLGPAGDEVVVTESRLRVRGWLDALRRLPPREITLDRSQPAVHYSRSVLWIGDEQVHPVGRGAFEGLVEALRSRGYEIQDRGVADRRPQLGCLAAILLVVGGALTIAAGFRVLGLSEAAAFAIGWIGVALMIAAPFVWLWSASPANRAGSRQNRTG